MANRKYSVVDLVGLGLLIVVGVLVVMRLAPRFESPVPKGTQLPAFNAEGWLNTPGGAPIDADGGLLVVDCWATWCAPCRADLPHMATIVADYAPRGVKFVGVTQETASDLPAIEGLIRKTPGFVWPIAYGATEFMGRLDIQGIPTVILFGRDGTALWSGYGSSGLEQALDRALAEPPGPRA